MSPRAVSFRYLFSVGVAVCAAPGAGAQLSSKSPFMAPSGAGAGAAPTAGASLEFIGYYEDRDGVFFRVREVASKKGIWARLNERNEEFGLIVKKHDVEEKTLTVDHQGKILTLAERAAKIAASGPSMQPMPPPMPSTVPTAVTQAVVRNPTPADEANRLNAVASEVARRRALRVQAEQTVNQPAAPQMAPPPTSPPAMQPAPIRAR